MPSRDVDPFGENQKLRFEHSQGLLGANFRFSSNSRALIKLVEHAYAHLPVHRFTRTVPELRVTLLLTPASAHGKRRDEPPPLELMQGAGLLAAGTARSDYAVLSPKQNAALVVVSEDMLRFPYQTRYELIEFAVFTLAARSMRLVPLHAACVGIRGRGVLLMGDTGAGKSTVSLQCLLQGFEFVSEDSVFVEPRTLRASGVANFLHVQSNSLNWVGSPRLSAAIRRSPVIRRRSGARKFEVDLRRIPFKLAAQPLTISAVIMLTPERTPAGEGLLKRVSKRAALARLAALQRYGASRPEWQSFAERAARLGVFELRRGRHPEQSAAAIRTLLTES